MILKTVAGAVVIIGGSFLVDAFNIWLFPMLVLSHLWWNILDYAVEKTAKF